METNNNADPNMTTKKRTMQIVQKEADKRARKIQLNFTQFCITNTSKQPEKDKVTVKSKIQKEELAHSDRNTINAETGHKEREKKNNHRKTGDNKKNKTEVQEMEREKMELLYGM